MKNALDRKQLIRVVIASDSQKEAQRMSNQLNMQPDLCVVGTANSEAILMELFQTKDVDVLISDVTLNHCDAFPLLATLSHRHPNLNIICYTLVADEAHVIRAVNSGVLGYILRSSNEDLANSVRLVHGGGSPVSPIVARFVIRALHSMAKEPVRQQEANSEVQRLSRRELEILNLLAKGISFVDIGDVLSISPHTVTAHIKKIYRKLQVHSRGECVYEARCLGLLPPV